MEDLVLFKLHPEASNAEEGVDSDHYTTPPEWPDATSLNDEVSSHPITDHSIKIRMERPESPLSSIGHLGLVRGQRNALRAELRSHEEAAVQAKQSISSLRKLALRLAVRISVKEARISTHARLLAQARMEKYLAERNSPHTLVPGQVRPESYPLSPPQSPEPGKPLPALPRWDSSGRVTTVRFSPVDQHSPSLTEQQSNHSYSARHNLDSTDQSQYGFGTFENQQLEKIDASRASLVKELEATQARLAKLFESQAVLRERYNNEREKARTLDAECQEIHAKVSTLEQSKHEVEEDAQHLHQRIEDLEQGNSRLKGELETAKAERSNIQEDLSKLQSSKLTLEHQLQAATASKDTWETQLQSLHLSSNKLEQELEEKMIEIKEGTEKSDNTISLLEAERQKLDDDLKVTKFRLSAAVDLELELRSKLSVMRDRESNLEKDLQLSRQTISKVESELIEAKGRLSAMDKTVAMLTAELERSEQSKFKFEEAARLAQESREQSDNQLQKERNSKAKTAGRLRTARSRLFNSETRKKRVETDIVQVQKRNKELEELVHKTENSLTAVVAKSTVSVEQLESFMAKLERPDAGELTDSRTTSEFMERDVTKTAVEDQLLVHQREIDTLHETNTALMDRLNEMTQEIRELKERKQSTLISTGLTSPQSELDPSNDAATANKLLDLEVKQLRETKATFNIIVKSLQAKSAELEVLEKWVDNEDDQVEIAKNEAKHTLEDSTEDLTANVPETGASGGVVKVQLPTVVRGHYAESEAAIVEISSQVLQKSKSDDALRHRKETQAIHNDEMILNQPLNNRQLSHGRSVSEVVRPTSSESFHSALATKDIHTTTKLELSESNLAKLNRSQKALPLRPSFSMISLLPRIFVDKDLPPIPRRPVPRQLIADQAKTDQTKFMVPKTSKDDIEIGRMTWSLFPAPPKSIDLPRPATAGGIGQATRLPQVWNNTAPAIRPSGPPPTLEDDTNSLDPKIVHSRPSLDNIRSSTAERLVRLKRSFSVLGATSKRPLEQRSKSAMDLRRKFSSALPPRFHGRRSSESRGNRIPDRSSPIPAHTNRRDAASPDSEPVGIYDPVAKMWLIPPSIAGARLGIYDPGSKQWLAPSPRSDSYRKVVEQPHADTLAPSAAPVHTRDAFDEIPEEEYKSENSTAASNQSAEVEPPKELIGRDEEEIDENEEEGALSLAEKLEIIRYNPLTRTLSSLPSGTLRNKPSTVMSGGDSMDSDAIAASAHRPWKPSQILGVSSPPEDAFVTALPKYENAFVFSEKVANPNLNIPRSSIESGSGYMSFESEYDERRKDWKGFWKKLKRSSNARKSEVGIAH